MYMNNVVLGLDISTRIVGISLYGPKLIKLDSIKLAKYDKNLFKKTDVVCERLQKIKEEFYYKTIKVYAEQSLKHFQPGKSNAATLFTLADFHGRIVQAAYNIFGLEPIELNAQSARKKVFGRARFPDFDNVKEAIAMSVLELEPSLDGTFPLRRVAQGKKPSLLFKDYVYDEMDAYVIAKAGWLTENEGKS